MNSVSATHNKQSLRTSQLKLSAATGVAFNPPKIAPISININNVFSIS
jgi:hypothetical protein